jgi:hypothetical protein
LAWPFENKINKFPFIVKKEPTKKNKNKRTKANT